MSDRAEVVPEEVRVFEGSLTRTTAGIQDSLGLLRMDVSRLGEAWRDQEYVRFCEEFDVVLRALDTFVSRSQEYSAYLLRKAGAAEDYIATR